MNNFKKYFNIIVILQLAFFLAVFTTVSVTAQDEEEFTQTESSQNDKTKNDPVELFNMGQEAHEKGNFEEAIKFYQDALKISPQFVEAEFQLANAYESLGQLNEAENSFRKALRLRPDWTLAMSGLGSLLVKKGSLDEAETILNKAVTLDQMNFPAYVALTSLYIQTNKSDESKKSLLAKLQYLTTKAKIPASVWASRGALERILGLKDEANNSIKNALLIDPKNYFGLSEKIELALTQGDFDAAIDDSNKLVKIDPQNNNAKFLLAKSYVLSGNPDIALEILSGIENPNSDITALKNTIEANSNENIESLEKLLATDEKNVSVLSKLCRLSRTENPEKALEYCQRASSIEPKNINHAIGFGAALVQAKRYTDAVGLFRQLLKNSPDNYTIRANLATALFQLNDFENAKIEYNWITEKQPDLAIAYYFLAISHDKLEEYIDAMANYQQFLRLADVEQNKLLIEKVNLRLPTLNKQIKNGKGKKVK